MNHYEITNVSNNVFWRIAWSKEALLGRGRQSRASQETTCETKKVMHVYFP